MPIASSRKHFALLEKLFQEPIHTVVTSLDKQRTLPGPLVVEIDPTTACNMTCPECISASLLNQGALDRERLEELLDDLAAMGTRAVIFIGGGEPTAHSAFGNLVERAAAHGLSIGLTTNGTRLVKHLDLIAERVSWTRVSMDAGTAETFAFFRPSPGGRLSFDYVLDQMRKLAAVKRGYLGYSFLLMARAGRTNAGEILAAAQIAKDIGCDYLEVKPAMNDAHEVIPFTPSEVEAIREQLKMARNLETESFQVLAPVTLEHALSGGSTAQSKEYDWCPATRYRTVVTPSGCYACPYHRGNQEFMFGSVADKPFRELWNGPSYQEVQARLQPSRDCSFHCIRHGQNRLLTDEGFRNEARIEIPVRSDVVDPFI